MSVFQQYQVLTAAAIPIRSLGDAGATFTISGQNTGTVNGSFNFSGIENLLGGSDTTPSPLPAAGH